MPIGTLRLPGVAGHVRTAPFVQTRQRCRRKQWCMRAELGIPGSPPPTHTHTHARTHARAQLYSLVHAYVLYCTMSCCTIFQLCACLHSYPSNDYEFHITILFVIISFITGARCTHIVLIFFLVLPLSCLRVALVSFAVRSQKRKWA